MAQRLRRVLGADPSDTFSVSLVAFAGGLLDRVDIARPLVVRMVELDPLALAAAGRVADALVTVATIEAAQPDVKVTWFSSAAGWALRGEGERLAASVAPFEWLERMMRTGAAPCRFVAEKDPFFSRVRQDPRWPALMSRLKLASGQVDI